MLRLQARHLGAHFRPLPMTAWVETARWPHCETLGRRTRNSSWQTLSGYRFVFWAPHGLDIYSLRQAVAADGLVSTAGPRRCTPEALREYEWKMPPDDLWHHIVEQARPWTEALSETLSKCKDVAIDKFLAEMEKEQEPLAPILSRSSPYAQQCISLSIESAVWPRAIELIVEANGCWTVQLNGRPGSVISDAILRVDRIVSDQIRDVNSVRGRIIYREKEMPIDAPLNRVEKEPRHFMRITLLDMAWGCFNVIRSTQGTCWRSR